MNNKNKGFLIAILVALVVFVWYPGGGITGSNGNEMMNNHGWLGAYNYGWFPALFTLGLGVLIGWALFKKKN